MATLLIIVGAALLFVGSVVAGSVVLFLNWRERRQQQPPTATYYFMPKMDITTYELAVIYSNLRMFDGRVPADGGIEITPEMWGSMPGQISRHFTRFEPTFEERMGWRGTDSY